MSHFHGRRIPALSVLVAAGAIVAVVAFGGGANAATQGGCVLKGTANLTPGLTATAKPTSYTFSGTFSNCKGTGVTVKSGNVTASGSGSSSCTANTTAGTASVTWNTGQTSTISFTTAGKGTVVQVVGTFTGGLFAGSKAKSQLLFYTTTPQACNTAGGLTKASFEGPSEIGV